MVATVPPSQVYMEMPAHFQICHVHNMLLNQGMCRVHINTPSLAHGNHTMMLCREGLVQWRCLILVCEKNSTAPRTRTLAWPILCTYTSFRHHKDAGEPLRGWLCQMRTLKFLVCSMVLRLTTSEGRCSSAKSCSALAVLELS
jgi:hypothetical protein